MPDDTPARDDAPAPAPATSPPTTTTGTSTGTTSDATAPASTPVRDIAEVPSVEVITTAAVHLMSAAAVKCGLAEDADPGDHLDLAEARVLISALAGLVTAAAPEIGNQHARALRDGLRSLQLAFREASLVPDPPGQGPGEKLTGPVTVAARRPPLT